MATSSDRFPSEYLKAQDLSGDTHVIIQAVTETTYQDGSSGVIAELHNGKKLGLNKTNWNTIAKLLGPDDANWGGGAVTLMKTATEFKGEMVPCIRVSPVAPSKDAVDTDDIPF